MLKNVQRALLILLALTISVLAGPANAEVTYFHHDALGSVVAATNESGTVLWRESYQPFGERMDKVASTDENASFFTGKPHDDRTGLTYFGARHYDPVLGRFMGIDPAGITPGDVHTFNRYAYANNNPYKFIDPDGRKVEFAAGSSAKFKKQFAAAIKYLNKGKVSGVFSQLQKQKATVYIQEASVAHDDYYDPFSKTISWDPLSALETTGSTASAPSLQSPALGLLHEGAHALGHLTGTSASAVPLPFDPYHNAEERRVITKIETPAAIKLGEGIRKDHSAKRTYHSKCPSCVK
jgi:RHS repeat-associated protein